MATASAMRRYRAKLKAERPSTWLDGRSKEARALRGMIANPNGRLLAAKREADRLRKARSRGKEPSPIARKYQRKAATRSPLPELPPLPDELSS